MTRSFLTRRTFLKGSAGLGILAAGLYLLPGTSLFRRAQNNAHVLFGNMNARFLRQIITENPATTRRIM
ncbi:Tat (twin-arginine translocation) pathway signal sequence [Selenomonas sp. GACV-9]|uniref:twin-arginine translocation signal domain-containing protein n=1 Tax=Selenomonas sp. GACV-9 TaxID=3158782 RepID=UPI0008EE2BE3|nr:Tat (twin-arginine translocation) pathway signal sequence [Selenomonas ruminantium]